MPSLQKLSLTHPNSPVTQLSPNLFRKPQTAAPIRPPPQPCALRHSTHPHGCLVNYSTTSGPSPAIQPREPTVNTLALTHKQARLKVSSSTPDFLNPWRRDRDYDDVSYYEDPEPVQPCLRISQKLEIVVEQAQDASGCDDGTIDATHVYEQREVLKGTCREVRMVVWGRWKIDIKVTEREKGLTILRRKRGHPDHVAWDEVGKRGILRILDGRVRGEIFGDVS